MAEAIRSAERRGEEARRDGQHRTDCPYVAAALRRAWIAGWDRFNMRVF